VVRNIVHHAFSNPKYSVRNFLVASSVIIFSLIVDISLSSVADIISSDLSSIVGIIIFIAIAVVYAVAQFFILEFIKARPGASSSNKSPYLEKINMMVTIVQYVLIGITGFIVFQIVFASAYYTLMPMLAVTISYGLGSAMMGLLSVRFLSWYRARKSIVTLLYGLSTVIISVSFAVTLIYSDISLLLLPAARDSQSEVSFGGFDPSSTLGILVYSFSTLNVANFVLIWVGTLLLLKPYSQRVGRAKFWTILIIPLVASLSIFFVLSPFVFGSIGPDDPNIVYVYIFGYTLPSLAAGILFGAPFWLVANSINNQALREYMIVAACGFVLLFVSSSGTVSHAPYPPFGLASVSIVGLSCYLILAGLYSSAISISEDIKLRRLMLKTVREEKKLLDSIGSAHLEEQMRKEVEKIAKDHADELMDKTGVNLSPTENEVKDYLDILMKEVNKNGFDSKNQRERSVNTAKEDAVD
jgi:hypothetical protein